MYIVEKATEYLVITGIGIADIKLARKSWILPVQSCTVFDLSLVNYTFEVQAMSVEKLPFLLPAIFTIGPRVDDCESLLKYAKLFFAHDKLSENPDGGCESLSLSLYISLSFSFTLLHLNYHLTLNRKNLTELSQRPNLDKIKKITITKLEQCVTLQ